MSKILIAMISAAALASTSAAAFAHEDREYGDYQLVVGFMQEPAYEGEKNAVSIRVTKEKEEGSRAADMGMGSHDSASHAPVESETPVSARISAELETGGGVNVHIMTEGWSWSPQGVNLPHKPGEGHAHIYVDGEKVGRVYAPYYHLAGLQPGERHIRVALNTNDHNELTVNGEIVEATATVRIPDTGADDTGMGGMESRAEPEAVGVEGLQDTLRVEVTHVPSGVSMVMNLRSVFEDPGHYAADLIPTSPGHYRMRVFGTVEGEEIDATFESKAGGGDFDDVQPASAIHFPDALPSGRELEGAARGAQAAAESARDAAMSAEESVSGASTLGLVGVALGALGALMGGGALLISMRNRSGESTR